MYMYITAKVKCHFVSKKSYRSDEKKLGLSNPLFGTGEKTTRSSEETSIFFNTKHISSSKSEQQKSRRKGYTIKTSNLNIARYQRGESSLHKNAKTRPSTSNLCTQPKIPYSIPHNARELSISNPERFDTPSNTIQLC